MTLCNLIKMKCCLVCILGGVTGVLLIIGHNQIYTGITGTIALVYGIALLMLVSIAIHEKIVNRGADGCLDETGSSLPLQDRSPPSGVG